MKRSETNPMLFFDPDLRADQNVLADVVVEMARYVQEEERRLRKRKRSRRAKDERNFLLAVEAIVCNLIATAMVSPHAVLCVPRGHAAIWGNRKYRSPVFGQHFLTILDLLCESKLIESLSRGYRFSAKIKNQSTFRPTKAFNKRVLLSQLVGSPFKQDLKAEVLILKSIKDKSGRSEVVDYCETKRTRRLRSEIQQINIWLTEAPVEVIRLIDVHSAKFSRLPIELHRRKVRRIFNNEDWNQGGRLFGAWWMVLERTARFETIRISNERIANVDFGSLFPSLAYVRAGQPQPEGDLYDICGDGQHRDGWKKLHNALLFKQGPLKGWPKGLREQLPKGIKLKDAVSALKFKHSPIAHLFNCGLGFRLMRFESDMLIATLTALFKQDIIALPLHDSVLVPASKAEITKTIMEETFKIYTGAPRATVKVDFGP